MGTVTTVPPASRYGPVVFKNAAAKPHGKGNAVSEETSHATAMDSEGNAMAMTQTIHQRFGSVVILPGEVPGSGLCINNTMELFHPGP